MESNDQPTRVCVIGAGFYGLQAAKTYLQVDPTVRLTVLEAEDSVGGTWSRRRIYPTLQAQQTYGVYEYGDFPVDTAGVDNPEMSFVTAERLHKNIAAYAERFGIMDKIRFGARVRRLERAGAGWAVSIHGEPAPLTFDKVVVATGLTSNPSLPDLDTAGFAPPAFHSSELGVRYQWLASAEVETVTVYGGGKSAVDAVYMCAMHGKHVNWVVRSDAKGNGASPLVHGIFRGTNSNNILSTRLASKLHPTLDAPRGWWYRFLHAGSGIGYWLLWKYWGWITRALLADSGYGTSANITKLQPKAADHAAFWASTPFSIITTPEVLDMLHSGEHVTVFRAEISALTGRDVVLSDGERLRSDAVIFATGYHRSEPIYSAELAAHLGVVSAAATYPDALREKWDALEKQADAEIVRLFPRLADSASRKNVEPRLMAPCRLYKNILPPALAAENDRSLVFVGALAVANTAIFSGASTLWAVAWLTGNLSLTELGVSQAEIEWDVALGVAFSRRRYPAAGVDGTYALYDWLPKVDSMLQQLGIETRRNIGKGALKDFFQPYYARDYRGIVDEWMRLRGLK